MECYCRLEFDAEGGGINTGEVGSNRSECFMDIAKVLALCETESMHTITPSPILLILANGVSIYLHSEQKSHRDQDHCLSHILTFRRIYL